MTFYFKIKSTYLSFFKHNFIYNVVIYDMQFLIKNVTSNKSNVFKCRCSIRVHVKLFLIF